jgi:antitoxin Phd
MYTHRMSKQYSIADARRNLPSVVDEVASGSEVQLTRRGRPVAVVVSVEEYERLKAQRTTFAEAYRAFRKRFPEGSSGISSRYLRSLRDKGRGRAVDL